MAFCKEVPVLEINNQNIKEFWPSLILAIRNSTFIALDTELSGLGDRRQLQAKNVEDRYKSVCNAARSRSILAIGISCFKLTSKDPQNGSPSGNHFQVQTFNLLALCSDNYMVETPSLKFLVDHGFDFNKQYSVGLPYHKGNKFEEKPTNRNFGAKKPQQKVKEEKSYLRLLMAELVAQRSTIVLHNALLDLVFLYGNLYLDLPSDLATFLADLNLMFEGGVFDTKVIAEFKCRMQASFLEYVFRKCLHENITCEQEQLRCLHVEFLSYPASVLRHVIVVPFPVRSDHDIANDGNDRVLCQSFSNHGWCLQGVRCRHSHDVDLIIYNEKVKQTASFIGSKKNKKKRKKNDNNKQRSEIKFADSSCMDEGVTMDTSADGADKGSESDCKEAESGDCSVNPEKVPADCGTHRAGYDAFMTGYAFAFFLTKYADDAGGPESEESAMESSSGGGGDVRPCLSFLGSTHDEFVNKVYLSGKDFALQISKSNFSKPSRLNLEKLESLRNHKII